jgi:hypothetical protein
MRLGNHLVLSAVCAGALSACGSDALSPSLVGSYARDTTMPDGTNPRLHLNITPTGIAVTGPTTAGSQAVTVGGAPVMGGSVKLGLTGSALFKKVKCSDESSCRFSTENGCEGTFTKEAGGSVVLVATGECESWSGKWAPDTGAPGAPPGSASAAASASASAASSAAPAIPAGPGKASPSASPTGSASASPSGSASGAATGMPSGLPTSLPTSFTATLPTASPKMACVATCNDTNIACVRECKVGELDCVKACSDTLVKCAQKCQ